MTVSRAFGACFHGYVRPDSVWHSHEDLYSLTAPLHTHAEIGRRLDTTLAAIAPPVAYDT